MEELKFSDLLKGKILIFLLLMLIASVVMIALKIMGTLSVGYDIALFPLIFDGVVVLVFMVAKYL